MHGHVFKFHRFPVHAGILFRADEGEVGALVAADEGGVDLLELVAGDDDFEILHLHVGKQLRRQGHRGDDEAVFADDQAGADELAAA